MATSKGFFGHRRGSTKSFTFSVLNGKQVTREKAEKVKNPRIQGDTRVSFIYRGALVFTTRKGML